MQGLLGAAKFDLLCAAELHMQDLLDTSEVWEESARCEKLMSL